jgi:hypothetical protein
LTLSCFPWRIICCRYLFLLPVPKCSFIYITFSPKTRKLYLNIFPIFPPLFLPSETAPLAVTFSIAEINKCKTETVVSILLWSRKVFFFHVPKEDQSKARNTHATAKSYKCL